MRTDITETIGASRVRVVVKATSWAEIIGPMSFEDWMLAVHYGDPRVIDRALRVMIRDAGDLKPLEVDAEVDRLMESEPIAAGVGQDSAGTLHSLVERAVTHALTKVEDVVKNSPAGAEMAEAETVPGTTSTT